MCSTHEESATEIVGDFCMTETVTVPTFSTNIMEQQSREAWHKPKRSLTIRDEDRPQRQTSSAVGTTTQEVP